MRGVPAFVPPLAAGVGRVPPQRSRPDSPPPPPPLGRRNSLGVFNMAASGQVLASPEKRGRPSGVTVSLCFHPRPGLMG